MHDDVIPENAGEGDSTSIDSWPALDNLCEPRRLSVNERLS